jgi:hypothetical protein
MSTNIHTGAMIKQRIDLLKIQRTVLAKRLSIPSTSIYAYEKRSSIQTANLMRLSVALGHNFFQDIANTLPAHYTTAIASAQDALVLQQAEEIKRLKSENELLKELIMGRKN